MPSPLRLSLAPWLLPLASLASLAACGPGAAAGPSPLPEAPLSSAAAPAPVESAAETLAFAVDEGRTQNRFFRRGLVAAHLLATSGEAPRLVVAMPAGNTGAGLWFEKTAEPVALEVTSPISGLERRDGMRGVSATLRASARELRVRRAVLGSVRFLRAEQDGAELPAWLGADIEEGRALILRRRTLDGKHHVEVALEPLGGSSARVVGGRVALGAPPGGGPLEVRVTVLADDEPLSPIPLSDLVVPEARADRRALEPLAFLAYDEKLLAGSWRFLTYFGRDTLLSVGLLMPSLGPRPIEAGLGSVIDRLSQDGDVAHEEEIGEFAALGNLEASPRPADLRAPRFDYGMVDDDFLLAPTLARYLLDTPFGRARAGDFLARRTPEGRSYAGAVRANLERVLRLARPFGERPSAKNLVALRPSAKTGEWRDSLEGLGGGRIPFNVNAALVPAAIEAAERLLRSGLLGADAKADEAAREAASLAKTWEKASAFFRVTIPAVEARRRIAAYASEEKLDAKEAVDAVKGPVVFPAVALDAAGKPVPVMHSDDGFALFFGLPAPEELERVASRIALPFPAGLRTPVGVVVANPAFAEAALRKTFTRGHYHGAVVWSWQQALLAAGLERQLERGDLPPKTRSALEDARRALWEVVEATEPVRGSELWSFRHDDGKYEVVPFGQGQGHITESNAAQLWSTVYLAVRPPAAR